MADTEFEALIELLEQQGQLLAAQAGSDGGAQIKADVKEAILAFRKEYKDAENEKDREAIYKKTEGVAKGMKAATSASIAMKSASDTEDPFAIAAAALDLIESVAAMVSAACGPVGAAVGAVLGAILSIVSMILKLFQKKSESLISQIERLMRNIEAERTLDNLHAGAKEISAFTKLAMSSHTNDQTVKWSYEDILARLNQNALHQLFTAEGWLEEKNNRELPR